MLELKNISKIYNQGTITEMCLFKDFNLTVQDGEFVSIVGSNGSGKTSMLNIICGSIPIEGGEICIDGRRINGLSEYKRYRSIGRIFQNPAVSTCPDLTLLENMALADNKGQRFGLQFGVSKRRVSYYQEQLATLRLGLEDKLDTRMGAFSGGQRQAVALVMATMSPLSFLILDEHTAALDPKTAARIMELADWTTMMLCGEEKRNSCTAGYKEMYNKTTGYPPSSIHPSTTNCVWSSASSSSMQAVSVAHAISIRPSVYMQYGFMAQNFKV